MIVESGTEYQIAEEVKCNFNSADFLKVIRKSGKIVQFTLGEGKGHGAMPIDHLEYLINKRNLTVVTNRRSLLKKEQDEKQIG